MKNISGRVTSNKSKHLLVEKELKKNRKFDASYFRGKNYFDGNDGTQNYLVFQPLYKYFEKTGNRVSSWRSKGLSDEKISTSNNPIVNIYIVCRLIPAAIDTDIVLENCLFGATQITKSADVDKYKYSSRSSNIHTQMEE